MPLAGTLEKLYARRRFGIRPGIDRVRFLLERLGHPERAFRGIHGVGTNGKGSTSEVLAVVLTAAGYRTALFTSPHLVSFTERFRINDREISSERLMPLLDTVLAQAPAEATFFELVTALAALCFAEERADIAVMEAGMGGRSDASAAIPGIMTVITPISLDHSDYLGTTPAEIATEKAAIAEPGTPMVTAVQTPEVFEVIRKRALSGGNGFFLEGRDFTSSWADDGTLDYRGIHATLSGVVPGIPGRYQAGNAALALAAAEMAGSVGLSVPRDALTNGMRTAHWAGRMELITGTPPILLDGAHNPAGATALAGALGDYRYQRLLLVTGIMADKDAAGIFTPLAGKVHRAYAVTPTIERALDDRTLAGLLTRLGIEAEPCGSVAGGIEAARRDADAGDLILVCGSLFTVGEAKAWLGKTPFEGIRG